MVMLLAVLSGCSDTISDFFGDAGIENGDPVEFTTMVPDVPMTRSAKDAWEKQVKAYRPMPRDYRLHIEMFKEGEQNSVGSATYKRSEDYSNSNYDGTLQPESGNSQLYWLDNQSKWGFKATAGSETLSKYQRNQNEWLFQDRLIGYSYLPIWDETNQNGKDDFDAINYRTPHDWYVDNKTAQTLSGLMTPEGSDGSEYKKIPLYMQHQRAWITVILHAGEGVNREALKYSNSAANIKMTINSYKDGEAQPMAIERPWSREALIDYDADTNGDAATNVSTTRYDAIVEPHNYATKKEEEVIAKINLSTQNFSFYASNDKRYLPGQTDAERTAADNAYNLEPGKHLTIDVTLSRESRKILITAWIEDWTEVATNTICDDYGNDGDPIVIKNLDGLKAFLSDEKKNKEGSTGIIQPTELNLDADGAWSSQYTLKATLNLAGCVLKTSHQLFQNMTSSANLVNGTIEVQEDATVKYAIADENFGTIERVTVTTKEENSTARATVAGMVGKNCGTIYQCTSTLPVYATSAETIQGASTSETYTGYIGGIAAISISPDNSSMAVIDRCTVNASVNGSGTDINGGGIVGYAIGRVTNNTYEYGITISQPVSQYKNIFANSGELRAYGNSWPTTASNLIGSTADSNPNEYTKTKYDAVIDCQSELHQLMLSSNNITGKNYRISKNFTVSSTNDSSTDWTHGIANDNGSAENNVSFNLDGNDKTITLDGTKKVITTTGTNLSDGTKTEYTTAPMLFNYVLGEIKNLNIYLEKPLVASPSEQSSTTDNGVTTTYNAADAIAPLAYAVSGESGKLTNIKVTARANQDPDSTTPDVFVQSSTPAGLVVWAFGGATITNCKVNVPIRMWLPETMGTDAKHYAGGIAACAADASFIRCKYLGNNEHSLTGAATSTSATKSANYYYGGIVGGTTIKGTYTPDLQITDCSSWYIATRPSAGDTDRTSKGAIIGTTCYASTDASHTITNGMSMSPTRISEGNWWTTSAIGANEWASGLNEEKVIGKKNGVEPDQD